jgi:hypothetical protein
MVRGVGGVILHIICSSKDCCVVNKGLEQLHAVISIDTQADNPRLILIDKYPNLRKIKVNGKSADDGTFYFERPWLPLGIYTLRYGDKVSIKSDEFVIQKPLVKKIAKPVTDPSPPVIQEKEQGSGTIEQPKAHPTKDSQKKQIKEKPSKPKVTKKPATKPVQRKLDLDEEESEEQEESSDKENQEGTRECVKCLETVKHMEKVTIWRDSTYIP